MKHPHRRPVRAAAARVPLAALEPRRLFAVGIGYEADLAFGTPSIGAGVALSVDLDTPSGAAPGAGHTYVSRGYGDGISYQFTVQKYDAAGAPVGAELTLLSSASPSVAEGDLAVAADGTMVLATNDGLNIALRRYDATGTQLGGTSTVAMGGAYTSDGGVSVAVAPDGKAVVGYVVDDNSIVIATRSVRLHTFSAAGVPASAPIVAGSQPGAISIDSQCYVGNVDATADGFAVAWTSGIPAINLANTAYARAYDWAGTSATAVPVEAEDTLAAHRFARVELGANGRFGLAWTELDVATLSLATVHARGFAADGTALGAAVELNADGFELNAFAELTHLGGDRYAAVAAGLSGFALTSVNLATGTTATTNGLTRLDPGGTLQALGGAGSFAAALVDGDRLALVGKAGPTGAADPTLPALRYADAYLNVQGTGLNDVIVVSGNVTHTAVNATLNGVTTDYAVTEFGDIRVASDAGHDRVNLIASPHGASVDLGAGDDKLHASAFADEVIAGDGRDHVWAGAGNDVLNGGAGRDFLYGENGRDLLRGEAGSDRLDGGSHSDTLMGLGGNDDLYGGGERFADKLYGGLGDDTLNGGMAWDRVDGGDGNDVSYTDVGEQVLNVETTETWTPTPR